MPKGAWKPRYLNPRQIRYLKAQEEKGRHLGFNNLADVIYTGELHAGRSHETAERIAKKTAGMQAVKKGVHRGTHRNHIRVLK
ncbi:MAG: hypothetical protein KGI28_09940 [Thaumarchaeota archaeon]|nr:hypothetical protein [Nitrososphaerota archaeon]